MIKKIKLPENKGFRVAYPELTVLVTSVDEKGNKNIITLAWTTPLSFNPPLYGISIAKKNRLSHELIKSSREFVVNIPPKEILKETLYCGRKSGKDANKFQETSLTLISGEKVRAPLIDECIGHLECKVINEVDVGDHTLFVGKIISCSVNEGIFNDSENRMAIERENLIYHLGGDMFTVNSSEVLRPKL